MYSNFVPRLLGDLDYRRCPPLDKQRMDIFQGSRTHVVMKAATKLLSSKTSNELLSKGIPRHSVSFIKYRPSLLQFSEVLNLMSESGEFVNLQNSLPCVPLRGTELLTFFQSILLGLWYIFRRYNECACASGGN